MKLKIIRDYLDFKKGKEYDVEPDSTAKYMIAMSIAKEVVAKDGSPVPTAAELKAEQDEADRLKAEQLKAEQDEADRLEAEFLEQALAERATPKEDFSEETLGENLEDSSTEIPAETLDENLEDSSTEAPAETVKEKVEVKPVSKVNTKTSTEKETTDPDDILSLF